jgi:hypothetical protein
MPRCVPTLAALPLVVALALAAGCASSDQAATPTEPAAVVATDAPAGGTVPADPAAPPAGSFVPSTIGPVESGDLPPALQGIDAMAGGDPAEAACIHQGIAASIGPDADRPAAHAGVAGTTVAQCLPPAKLAATLVDRLRDPDLGLALTTSQLACIRATLASEVPSPAYTVLVGGVALDDVVVIRQGAGPLDAACGTRIAAS